MKRWNSWGVIFVFFLLVYINSITVQAGTIYNSPYVSFSPDKEAWTTDEGNQNIVWYEADGSDDVSTRVERTLSDLQTGQHFYSYRRAGAVPIAEWIVYTPKVNCCHNAYPADGEFHGVNFVMQNCYKPHFSGWRPICADCRKIAAPWNFYMSKEAAQSLSYLEFGENISYYYLCPFNNNLEMGMSMRYHNCLDISANRYRVRYDANTDGELYSGYMSPSFHMYGNAKTYEGREVTPQTHLNLNSYGRIGWEFVGWNTAADGSGTQYEDGAEVLNLCEGDFSQDEDAGTVTLYAIWKASKSVLEIDPNGGYYRGESEITEIEGEYGSVVSVEGYDITAPEDIEVSFDTCGGEELDSIWLPQYFAGWKQSIPFHGKIQEDQYTYSGEDGSKDRITALYEVEPRCLPNPSRENYSFTGWYYDPEYMRKAGDVDSEFVSEEDVTLYAQWAELVLETEKNEYTSYLGGALNLSWSQDDGNVKSYKLYQCAAGREWQQIHEMDDETETAEFYREFDFCEEEETFVVPYTGFYYMEAYGAQGGDYEDYTGGLGGMVKGTFWLEEGQEVSVCVGGQYGYNGGGEANSYERGGGYTSVYVSDKILLIAGGGGGAGNGGNGGDGGMETCLVEEGHDGESGGAGGGGGYLGGKAGAVTVHNHEKGVCNHVHEGKPSEEGGCYTRPIKCGKTLTHTHTRTEHWYWGGTDEIYCPNCGADATKGETCIGHDTKYYRHDCPVHGKQASNTKSAQPATCSAIAEYGLTCERTEEYIFGYPYDGYIISSLPSYGGSSYANEELATSFTKTPGLREGDGYAVISSENLGFYTDTTLEDVPAFDMASPKSVSMETVKLTPMDETTVCVQWDNTQDLGTVYYHKAESYLLGEDDVLSISNITADNMVSGMYGYMYVIDSCADTEVDASNGKFQYNPDTPGKLTVSLKEEKQYLHLAVLDYAENYSETIHIPLGNLEGENIGVKWPVLTEPLKIEEGESVCWDKDEEVYYVKSDGSTPFVLHYDAYLQGVASNNYQLNYAIVESGGKEQSKNRNIIYIPSCNLTDDEKEYPASDLMFRTEGEGYLQNGSYFLATRSKKCKNLSVEQQYVLTKASHGKRIELMPIAGVDDAGQVIYSDYEKDKDNGIEIIGDGEAPVISGMQILENLPVLDRRIQEIYLKISATDELSGVKELYVEIENLDNGARRTYVPGENDLIEVDLCADEVIFSGDFTVTAFAIDNVGNENSLCYGTTEFDLHADIRRMLLPEEPLFKKGEMGCLDISSWGYAERIEVEFPAAFTDCNPDLNRVYEYELKGGYKQEEQLIFMIPWEVPDGNDYVVTVRAYKGDKMIERYPALAVFGVNGSILDNLRTRLR